MMSLSTLLAAMMAILQAHPLCKHAEVVETKAFSADQFFFKIRADFPNNYHFQLRIYCNRGHIDYAYQLFTDIPLMRWDNKEEFPHLHTFPHHYHDENGNITESPLTGEPVVDMNIILKHLSQQQRLQI